MGEARLELLSSRTREDLKVDQEPILNFLEDCLERALNIGLCCLDK